jgi:tetrahydromethanopterin S-methyltransferase subunit C
MIKQLLFSVFIIAFQNLPKLQITLIIFFQSSFVAYLAVCAFRFKIFKSCFFGFVECCTEICILTFLVIGMLFAYKGREGYSQQVWAKLQTTSIFLIMVKTGLNIIYTFYAMKKPIGK